MLKKHVLNELHEMPIKREKSGVCRERSTIGKTTLADLGSSGESRAGSSPVIRIKKTLWVFFYATLRSAQSRRPQDVLRPVIRMIAKRSA